MPDFIQEKIHNLKTLQKTIAVWRFKDQKIVFTNGCFDLLHRGHLHLLNEAAKLGDKLIVAINSNSSIKALKGADRPIVDQKERAYHLACLKMVDAVIVFNADTPLELIKTIRPEVLVKGNDYKPKDIVGADEVLKNNGKVCTIPFLKNYSTTDRINHLK